jgi:hypothetical protein
VHYERPSPPASPLQGERGRVRGGRALVVIDEDQK